MTLYMLEHTLSYNGDHEHEFCGIFDSEEGAKNAAKNDCPGFTVLWTVKNEYNAIFWYYIEEAYWSIYPINANEYYSPCWIQKPPKKSETDEVIEMIISQYGINNER